MTKSNILVTSDAHFFHENILKFTDRPYKTIGEMEADYIKRWNSKVNKCDLVYILGDHIWNTVSSRRQKELNDKLNGNKILVEGNHCKCNILQAVNRGYICVVQEAVIKVGKDRIILSHYPYRYGFWKGLFHRIKFFFQHNKWPDKTRYSKNLKDEGKWLLQGHSHSKDKIKGKQIHVGVDAWNGYPVSLHQIQQLMDSQRG